MEESKLAVDALCTTTPMGVFLLLPLIEQSLPPLIYNRLLRNFPCPNYQTTSLMPVCITSPTSEQTAMYRHESPLCSRIGVISERASATLEYDLCFASKTAVFKTSAVQCVLVQGKVGISDPTAPECSLSAKYAHSLTILHARKLTARSHDFPNMKGTESLKSPS